MNKRIMVALTGVFLGIALILPTCVIIESNIEDLRQYNNFLRDHTVPLDDTEIEQFISITSTRHQTIFTILLISELILVTLFAITLWLTIKK
jgi:hypothetical protein